VIIPDRVIICGKIFDILYLQHDYKGYGYGASHYGDSKIYISRAHSEYGVDNIRKEVVHTVMENVSTFYHEYLHTACRIISLEHDNEPNCELFSLIAINLGKDFELMSVLAEFKTVVTDISEQDYRKLEYVVKNTTFEFDKLPIEKDGDGSYYDMMSKRLDEIMDKDDDMTAEERTEMEIIAVSMEKYEKFAYPLNASDTDEPIASLGDEDNIAD